VATEMAPSNLVSGSSPAATHFHPSQWEFFRVLRGNLTIDINGVPVHRTVDDGEMAVPPYTHHPLEDVLLIPIPIFEEFLIHGRGPLFLIGSTDEELHFIHLRARGTINDMMIKRTSSSGGRRST
jgi:hypothetical protein